MTQKHWRHRRTTPSRGPIAVASALAAGLLISGFTVWTASSAAFTGSTDNTTNQWHAAKVALSDNDGGATAMFNQTLMTPLTSVSKCIVVTYTGDVAPTGNVMLYGLASSVSTTPNLAQYLDLQIQVSDYSSAGAAFDCSGFDPLTNANTISTGTTLYTFQTTKTGFGNGVDTTWHPAAGDSKMFKFTTVLQDNNAANDKDITGVPFTWEVERS
ncbi:hypothetical protein FB565_001141 [Actinoplanes lutulentus]|uniref:Ribosomally synthesized peptide with SipW-like signal peptide n=1 Tax=Actinoplanes lutulentus TaxID=1287878 RepID=A0A327ZJU6_9ACTN|nr:hypothetical protein [Actinoplanes lutulentus]MBB2941437.1 hypothetical protein [Actinoplanes lutulentus]RAK36928.1 hypothetical protein B0I29_107190 [Actinoplanes lutulentus]